MTQLEKARSGAITPEMVIVAEKEKVDKKGVAQGSDSQWKSGDPGKQRP